MAQHEWKRTTYLIERAIKILTVQWPATIRQLFYQMVSAAIIENSLGDYRLVSRIMTIARNDGRCPWEYIVDRSRPTYSPNVFEDLGDYVKVVKKSYRKDYWATQPNHVEIWTEKDAVIGSIEDLANELGVTVRVSRGFSSTTRAHEAGVNFQRLAELNKPVTVLGLGDHDPSGRSIEADNQRRAQGYGVPFTFKRLAILAGDIQKFRLPPLRVKDTDSRAPAFLSKYSNKCVELDALPPAELRRRIREAVTALLDLELWERAIAVERVELASIVETVSKWPGARASSWVDNA